MTFMCRRRTNSIFFLLPKEVHFGDTVVFLSKSISSDFLKENLFLFYFSLMQGLRLSRDWALSTPGDIMIVFANVDGLNLSALLYK